MQELLHRLSGLSMRQAHAHPGGENRSNCFAKSRLIHRLTSVELGSLQYLRRLWTGEGVEPFELGSKRFCRAKLSKLNHWSCR
jgi:hypothetical protein